MYFSHRHYKDVSLPQPMDVGTLFGVSTPCFFLIERYWSYELCGGRNLRQYHVAKESLDGIKRDKTSEYILGSALEPYQGWDQPVQTLMFLNSQVPYLSQVYSGGTECDLTGQLRETEVRFICDGINQGLVSIDETSTCRYKAIVKLPAICKIAGFKPKEVSH